MLVLCKILRMFANTLTGGDKYSPLNKDNLLQRIQVLLSQKQNTFSQFFFSFLKCTVNFDHFQKKDDPPSRVISKITASEKSN